MSDKVRDASVASVIRVLKRGLKRGAIVNVEECIAFVENNMEKVSNAYFEAAKRHKVFVSRDDAATGYDVILETLEREQSKYDSAYVTGLGRSGRSCFR